MALSTPDALAVQKAAVQGLGDTTGAYNAANTAVTAAQNITSTFGTPNLPTTINSNSLKGGASVNLPPPPPSPNYTGVIQGAAANLAGNGAALTPPEQPQQTDTTGQNEFTQLFEKYGMLSGPMPSAEQNYNALYSQSGIPQAQDQYNQKLAGYNSAKANLQSLEAQINGISTNAQAAILQTEGQGGLLGQFQGRAAEINRQAAIKALPLQAAAFVAQANVANAKGEVDLAQTIMAQAKDHLDTVFELHQEDVKNQYQYQQDLRKSIYDFATAQEQRKLDAQQKADDRTFTMQQNQLNYAQSLASTAIQNGQPQLAASITQLDPRSPTYGADVAKFAGQIQQNPLDVQLKQAQLANIRSEISARNLQTSAMSDPSQVLAYAQQYAQDGKIPMNLPKGVFGVVAQAAKELPKPEGTLVSNTTGVTPNHLSSTQIDGITALKDLQQKLVDAKTLYDSYPHGVVAGTINKLFPSTAEQQYQALRGEIVDLLARARTGAAINASEEAMYMSKLPGDFNKSFFLGGNGDTKIDSLQNSLSGKLDTALKTNNVSIYGYSKVDVGGQKYTVGQIVTNSQGQQGRINPDGSITLIQ